MFWREVAGLEEAALKDLSGSDLRKAIILRRQFGKNHSENELDQREAGDEECCECESANSAEAGGKAIWREGAKSPQNLEQLVNKCRLPPFMKRF